MRRVIICVAAVLCLGVIAPQAQAITENSNNYGFMLDVWTNNTENFQNVAKSGECMNNGDSDPSPLVNQMQTRYFPPDIVLIQQVNGSGGARDQLQKFVSLMNTRFYSTDPNKHAHYSFVIAESNPAAMSWEDTQPMYCLNKVQQTNAVVYRDNRLTLDSAGQKLPQQSILNQTTSPNPCTNVSGQARTNNVIARFIDTRNANKRINATSIHWPSFKPNSGQPSCAYQNATRASNLSSDSATALNIVGGDTNVRVTEDGGAFYTYMGAGDPRYGYGFREAFGSENDKKFDRLDYLFARNLAGSARTIYNPETISGVFGHTPVHGWVYY